MRTISGAKFGANLVQALLPRGPNGPEIGPRAQSKKNQNLKNSMFMMFFSSGIGSRPSQMAPWTPRIDKEILKEFQYIDF